MTKYLQDTIAAIDLKVVMLQSLKRNWEATFKDWTIEADGPEEVIKAPGRPRSKICSDDQPAFFPARRSGKLCRNP